MARDGCVVVEWCLSKCLLMEKCFIEWGRMMDGR